MAITSISAIRPYFRGKLVALKFKEWKDGFNFENIPSTFIDRAFHIEMPGGSRVDIFDMSSSDIYQDVVTRVFLKGYRNPAEAIDEAVKNLELILESVLDSSTRLGTDIKNIYYINHNILPLSDSNDNAVILEITFSCLIIICI